MGEKKCSVFKDFYDIHPKVFGGKRCILLLGVPDNPLSFSMSTCQGHLFIVFIVYIPLIPKCHTWNSCSCAIEKKVKVRRNKGLEINTFVRKFSEFEG